MAASSAPAYFKALCVAGLALLWGSSAYNGTLAALLRAAWAGQLDDETALRTRYTGIVLLDFPIAVVVAFFVSGTDGSRPDYQLFVMDVFTMLQPAFVWLYAEGLGPHRAGTLMDRPILWALLWQSFGGAVVFPAYFLLHHASHAAAGRGAAKPSFRAGGVEGARALPFSFFLGAVVPSVIVMLTNWYPRDKGAHQIVLALWLADPVWVSLVQRVLTVVQGPSCVSMRSSEQRRLTTWWLRMAFLVAAFTAGVTHVYVLAKIIWAPEGGWQSLARIYIPSPFGLSQTSDPILLRGPWLFLQYDWIIMSLASSGWAFFQMQRLRTTAGNQVDPILLIALLAVGAVLLGSGSTVSLIMFWREGILQQNAVRRSKM